MAADQGKRCDSDNGVEVLGRYSNHSEQGERIHAVLELVPAGPSDPIPRTTRRVCRQLTATEQERRDRGTERTRRPPGRFN